MLTKKGKKTKQNKKTHPTQSAEHVVKCPEAVSVRVPAVLQ
jgi:hypothetical protein